MYGEVNSTPPNNKPLCGPSQFAASLTMSKQAVVLGDENVEFETSKGVKVMNSFDAMGLREEVRAAPPFSIVFSRPPSSPPATDACVLDHVAHVRTKAHRGRRVAGWTQLLRGLYSYGFEKPSAIQARAVVPILNKRDVIAQAQSGTGKTSLIALTLCQLVDTSSRECVLHAPPPGLPSDPYHPLRSYVCPCAARRRPRPRRSLGFCAGGGDRGPVAAHRGGGSSGGGRLQMNGWVSCCGRGKPPNISRTSHMPRARCRS